MIVPSILIKKEGILSDFVCMPGSILNCDKLFTIYRLVYGVVFL